MSRGSSRILAATVGAGVQLLTAVALQAQCGEAPSDYCDSARWLPGSAGVHEVWMDVANATASGETLCGIAVGHTVWFRMTPDADGVVTFSTCHPNTTYDTVVEVWRGGDSGCEFMTSVDCVDDTFAPGCNNGCSGSGSVVTFPVSAGVLYRIAVGSYNNNPPGCTLCLGVTVTICGGDDTAPVADLLTPTPLSCACDTVDVYGSAFDTDSALAGYVLDCQPVGGGDWTTIAAGTTPVIGGLLGSWNTTGLPGGWYTMRLTAKNVCGLTNTDVGVVWLDKALDSLSIRSPAWHDVLGGTVCLDGTAWDQCAGWFVAEYRAIGSAFQPFDTINPPWIITDPLGTWVTSDGEPDGEYEIRLTATDACGNAASESRIVAVDNTRPIAVITSPLACSFVEGNVLVVGTVQDAHLDGWSLAYTGGDAAGWVTIASSSSPVVNGVLAEWNTAGLRRCAYTLRLVATDQSVRDCNGALRNQTEHLVSVNVGRCCDLNGDGVADGADVQAFVSCLVLGVCP